MSKSGQGPVLALIVGCLATFSPAPVCAQERPTPLATHRYVPGQQELDAAAEQEAQAYRSRLAGERLRLERGLDSRRSPAVLLRRQGEVNREIDRVEELLNR
jgi:hypothetical protein